MTAAANKNSTIQGGDSKVIKSVGGHAAGRCCLAWLNQNENGNPFLATGGEDALVKLWKVAVSSDEVKLNVDATRDVECANDKEVSCLARIPSDDSTFLVATQDGEVRRIDIASGELKGIVTRVPLGCRDVKVSDGGWAAVAGEDGTVRVVSLSDPVDSFNLGGHVGAVKAVAWEPVSGAHLATFGADGTAKIFDVTKKAVVKSIACGPKDASPDFSASASLGQISWNPQGDHIAIPASNGIRVVSKATWNDAFVLELSGDQASIVTWSPNGRYICAASVQQRVSVWDVKEKKVVALFTSPKPLLALRWIPQRNGFAAIDSEGDVSLTNGAVPSALSDPATGTFTLMTETDPEKSADMETDEIETTDISKMKADLGIQMDATVLSDKQEKRLLREGLKEQIRQAHEGMMQENAGMDKNEPQVIIKEVAPPRIPAQSPFNPSSSSFTKENGKRKFLLWNAVGSIVAREDDAFNSVEIEFADNSVRNIKFSDHYGFTLGSLSPEAAFFASIGDDQDPNDADDDDADAANKHAVVFYRPFNAWTHDAEWRKKLPVGEQPECIAVGSTFCACATTKGLLRLFRPSGIEELPQLMPGAALSMVASGPFLLILFHVTDPTVDGTQMIGYRLANAGVPGSSATILSEGRFPMTPGAVIEWCGFSDESMGLMPFVLDSDGMLFGLCQGAGFQWVPFLDTKAIKEMRRASCWPVCVKRGRLLSVVLKGKKMHPKVLPRPVLAANELRIPILGIDGEKKPASKFIAEESLLREDASLRQRCWASSKDVGAMTIMQDDDDDDEAAMLREEAQLDKKLLRLLQAILKKAEKGGRSGGLMKALGMVRRLRMCKSVEIASVMVRQCKAAGAGQLLERVELLLQQFNEAEADHMDDASVEEEHDGDNNYERGQNEFASPRSKAFGKRPVITDEDEYVGDEQDDDEQDASGEHNKRKRNENEDLGRTNKVHISSPRVKTPGAKINPFKKKTMSSPAKSNGQGLLGVFNKESTPVLQRSSTFSKEARTKARHDRLR